MNILNIDPLHPAIVHFPIAFLVLGAVIALVAVFLAPKTMSIFAAILLILGAAGAYYAAEAGDQAADSFWEKYPETEAMLKDHEGWADKTLPVAYAAGFIALVSACLRRIPKAFRIFRILTAIAALAAAYCVYETAERGGLMVYRDAMGLSKTQEAAKE